MLKYDEGLALHLVNTKEQFAEMVADLSRFDVIAFDTETSGLDPFDPETSICGICLSGHAKVAYYIPVDHKLTRQLGLFRRTVEQLPLQWVLDNLAWVWYDRLLVAQNMKFDAHVLENHGVKIKHWYFDTLIAQHILNEQVRKGLKDMTRKRLNRKSLEIKEVMTGLPNFSYVDVDVATVYAAADACNTLAVYHQQLAEFEQPGNERIYNIFRNIEMPLIKVVMDIERQGICLNVEHYKKLYLELGKELHAATEKIRAILEVHEPNFLENLKNEEFNPSSPDQLEELFGERWGLYPPEKKGYDKKVLEELYGSLKHKANEPKREFIHGLLRYRYLSKLRGTYTLTLVEKISSIDNRLHPELNQSGTRTGRFSSRNPNGQNMPKEGKKAGEIDIRIGLLAPPGRLFAMADYSSMEMRLTAAVSGDPTLRSIVDKKLTIKDIEEFPGQIVGKNSAYDNELLEADAAIDIHRYVAMRAFKVLYHEVTDRMRDQAKTVGFGILYGQTKYGLAAGLKISLKEAEELIRAFFDTFPRVEVWLHSEHNFLREHGYNLTMWGRRRRIPKFIWDQGTNAPGWEGYCRAGANHVIQGTGADYVKYAMILVHRKLREEKLDAKLVWQIHDELIVDCKEDPYTMKRVAYILETSMYQNLNGLDIFAEAEFKRNLSKAAEKIQIPEEV